MARSDEFVRAGYDLRGAGGGMAWVPPDVSEAARHAHARPRLRTALVTGGILGACAYAASIAAFAHHAVVPGAVLLAAGQVAFAAPLLRRRRRAPGRPAHLAAEPLRHHVADVPEACLAQARQRPPSIVHVAPGLELSMN
jgi:hypothetical protein